MKKLVSIIICGALSVSLLAGCGAASSEASEDGSTSAVSTVTGDTTTEGDTTGDPVTLSFWTISLQPTFTDFFNDLIAQYEEENPNVTIEWTDLPEDSIQEKLVTAAAGGTAPDVVNLNTQMALTLAGKDALVDMNQATTEEEQSIYIPSLYESAQIGDSVYALPWYASPDIMFYNTALFDEAGLTEVPTNYTDAFEMAKTMKDTTGAYLYNPPEFFYLLLENGIPILNDDCTAAAFNTSETVDLLTEFKEMTDADYLPSTNWGDWDTELKLYETGKLATISSSGSSLSRISDEAPDIYDTTEVAEPITGSTGLTRNALMNLVVPSASENQTEAVKFAAWLTDDENQLAFCKEVAIFPSTTAAAADSYFTSDDTTLEGQAREMSVKVSETSTDYSLQVEGQSDIQDAVNQIYEAVISNGKDIQTALDEGEESVNAILQQ